MKVFESLDITEKFINPVLTIGNYDGLHLGHRRIIERVREKAGAIGGTSMLMTFHPHPLKILKPEKTVGLITPIHVKKRLLAESGIDVVFIVPFTEVFRSISPEAFVGDILVGKLGIKGLIVGYDFKFGKEGKGNVDKLLALSSQYGYFFEIQGAITLGGEKVGSNRIRKMIREGEMEKVMRHLGRPYMIEGRVVKGYSRGTAIGFPTVNLETEFDLIPRGGVYVTEVEQEGRRFPSVTNIGFNPTFNGQNLSIETHILDFSEDLYGKEIALYFRGRVRDEVKFGDVEALKARIRLDVEAAREYFRNNEAVS
ncbi:bifunctional riboflavin kinase/FAD synthetase [Syntrophorhabdus aromaticivorans]|uniref:bifunctional riboflavin kinase/FAD synthetase n=1 Tax=Syntrophorhabdus aromaticivorans TaxID=328301 RepID=UPI00041BA1A4|nr:bifunctional riboflavin kinase/FAD synthetase [Syntrophorhabdus aromaticivorans]